MPSNWAQYAAAHQNSTVSTRIEKTLRYIAAQSRRPGGFVTVNKDNDYPVADCQGSEEFGVYLGHLASDGMILGRIQETDAICSPTIKGWQAMEPHLAPGGVPGTCFIAMSFDPKLTEAFDLGFMPAIEDCGFSAVRIDRKEHNNQITDEIMAGIRSAEFMVADFTGHRGGVYYEAGFARGLGREVIYCCREDSFTERHFDTSVINHVVWTGPKDLRRKLADRIKATILPKA